MPSRLSRAPATAAILGIIIGVYIVQEIVARTTGVKLLFIYGAIGPWQLTSQEPWRLVTGMFLHAGLLHLFANSFSLYQLGSLYEALFSTRRFLLVYAVSGLIASISSAVLTRSASVGASGAVLGVLGAFFFSIKRSPRYRNEPWAKGLIAQLVMWAGFNIVLGLSVDQIDNAAHIGGLIAGLLLGLIPHRVPPPPPGEMTLDVNPYEESAGDPADRRFDR